MAWRLESLGSRRAVPMSSDDDGIGTLLLPRDQSTVFEQVTYSGDFDLTDDNSLAINLGACRDQFHWCSVRVKGGACKLSLTSDLGTAVIPVEPAFEVRADNHPFTAISVQRFPGIEVTVNVFLGKRSS